ncbi:HD family phosphohydrolase, partial [Geobacillus thermodenitrificans]|nr:HD family phosphohydrolase [Geobacillus thermodenitrificans]
MTFTVKWQGKIYLSFITLIALSIFWVEDVFVNHSLKDWVFVYILSAAVLLLSYFSIHLPPKGNSFSMDSAIYLAVMFLYGIH